jgi:hypothetical protein
MGTMLTSSLNLDWIVSLLLRIGFPCFLISLTIISLDINLIIALSYLFFLITLLTETASNPSTAKNLSKSGLLMLIISLWFTRLGKINMVLLRKNWLTPWMLYTTGASTLLATFLGELKKSNRNFITYSSNKTLKP